MSPRLGALGSWPQGSVQREVVSWECLGEWTPTVGGPQEKWMVQPQQLQPTPRTYGGELTSSGLFQVGAQHLIFIEPLIESLNMGIPGRT